MEAHEDYLRREAKQLKRENTPPRDLSDAYKVRSHEGLTPLKMKPAHEGLVATVKEAGRSIHEIPREELRRTPDISLTRPLKEGSITQVSMGQTADEIGPTQAAVLAQTLGTIPKVKGEQRGLQVANTSLVRIEALLGYRLPFSIL